MSFTKVTKPTGSYTKISRYVLAGGALLWSGSDALLWSAGNKLLWRATEGDFYNRTTKPTGVYNKISKP